MHGPTLTTLILAASILGVGVAAAPLSAADPLTSARQALADGKPTAAIQTLEQALGDPGLAADPAAKQAVLGLLRQSYEAAADQATAAGRTREATAHRENARILARKTGGSTVPTPTPTPTPKPAPAQSQATTRPGLEASAPVVELPAPVNQPIPDGPASAPTALPEMPVPGGPVALMAEPLDPSVQPRPMIPAALADRLPEPEPTAPSTPLPDPVPTAQPASSGPGLVEADAAFRAKKYAEAGRIYGSLAQQNQLPADRAEHWAYCRACVVAKRLSAGPKTSAEWTSIRAESEQIRQLAPGLWIGNYLVDAAEKLMAARKPVKPGSTVVRAASPEEPPVRTSRIGRGTPTPPPAQAAADSAPTPSAAASTIRVDTPILTEPTAPPGAPVGRWRVRETENFQIFHADPKLAEQVAQVAESVRREATKRWSGKAPLARWQPRCEIYLFPNAGQYAQMTGQPADSPGFSTMGMNQGQITARRVNVRTDHDGLLTAVLPHEITHVILADFFTEQQIPRWADEGMAVLTEPGHEQKRRANDLVGPLRQNLLFEIDKLMEMDYPDNQYWNLYYAQSVSLTRYLVEQGTPAQFIQFLQGAQTRGFEAELKRVYKIDGFGDLQARWVAYARAHTDTNPPATTATATAANDTRPGRRNR